VSKVLSYPLPPDVQQLLDMSEKVNAKMRQVTARACEASLHVLILCEESEKLCLRAASIRRWATNGAGKGEQAKGASETE
jgi:hypothetical protein